MEIRFCGSVREEGMKERPHGKDTAGQISITADGNVKACLQ